MAYGPVGRVGGGDGGGGQEGRVLRIQPSMCTLPTAHVQCSHFWKTLNSHAIDDLQLQAEAGGALQPRRLETGEDHAKQTTGRSVWSSRRQRGSNAVL